MSERPSYRCVLHTFWFSLTFLHDFGMIPLVRRNSSFYFTCAVWFCFFFLLYHSFYSSSVWNFEKSSRVGTFRNQHPRPYRISDMTLINAHDAPYLLVAAGNEKHRETQWGRTGFSPSLRSYPCIDQWISYCIIPLCWVTFCLHSGIIPVGQFSRKCAKSIDQAQTFMVNLYNHFGLIGLLDSHRPICFYGGGAKVTQHNGIIQ